MIDSDTIHPVLINGRWRDAKRTGTFQAVDPSTGATLPGFYPISRWEDCEEALAAAARAAEALRDVSRDQIADFLDCYAQRIEQRREELVDTAHAETGLPVTPRLADVELPRTLLQLRQGAAAARERSWTLATIDTANNIRSWLAPLGPVAVFGPNNFPFAFGSVSGGDFVAAVAAGNPVIAKANSSHPGTTRLFAEEAFAALQQSQLPAGMVQLIYRTAHADGERLVSDPRLGATGYTGSRRAGLALKAAADRGGKPIYLELSSINPVVLLPGALASRGAAVADEFSSSCLMGTGQFCTNPGFVLLVDGPHCESFIAAVAERFAQTSPGVLLSAAVRDSLAGAIEALQRAGAQLVTGEPRETGPGFRVPNTLLRASGDQFCADPDAFQIEAFGNASLIVVARDGEQLGTIVRTLEGNLTGAIYSDPSGADDYLYGQIAADLRDRVGRLLNDKMPTGVAVSPAMQHGGPYPATGHPGFTAVGIPAALRRFAMLQCYDNVRPGRLPAELRDANPNGLMWRCIDGRWTRDDASSH